MSWYDGERNGERNGTPELPETTLPRAMAAFAAFEYAILRSLAAGPQNELPARADETINLIVGILSSGGAGYRPSTQEGLAQPR